MQRNNLSYYDQWAKDWWQDSATVAPLNQLNPLRFHFFDRYISNWRSLTVLDIGCGGGFTCEFLSHKGANVTGLDQSAACIQAAQKHATQSDLTIEYRQGEAEQLPFADASFDIITCVDVLEHVADPQQTIAEISRVLKPGGTFCFDTINRTWQSYLVMIQLLENLTQQIPKGVHDWQKFITPTELIDMMKSQDFTIQAIAGFDLFGKGILGKWQRLRKYRQTGELQVDFDRKDRSSQNIMYIGVASKLYTQNHKANRTV